MGLPDCITRARAELVINHPFFASLLLTMPMIERDDIPTLATDGESNYYNRKFMESLRHAEVVFTLGHEALHTALNHPGRRGARDSGRWNEACDYIVNEILMKEKVGMMPQGCLYNPSLVAQGNNSVEGVYNILTDQANKAGKNGKPKPSPKPGTPGGALDSIFDAGSKGGKTKPDQAAVAAASAASKIRTAQAANAARMQGNLSGEIERIVKKLLKPQVDWRDQLRRFFMQPAKIDATYARPKRRFLGEDLYLPSQTGQRMGSVVVAVDCSGSISDAVLSQCQAEINAIREDLQPSETHILYFDTVITGHDTLPSEDGVDFQIKTKAGGGTMFSPIFKYVGKHLMDNEPPAAIVVLTDLMCSDFGTEPESPVLWCVIGSDAEGMSVPFGTILGVEGDT